LLLLVVVVVVVVVVRLVRFFVAAVLLLLDVLPDVLFAARRALAETNGGHFQLLLPLIKTGGQN